jgi:hypothetical protein
MFKLTWPIYATNFGDTLTPKIFDYFNLKYVNSNEHLILSTGSIARHANSNTYVLGSGIISKNDKLVPNAKWLFVRGPYTRNRILFLGGSCPRIYGDPGLLLSLMVDESKKEYDLGIIPHVVDYDIVKEKYPSENIINLKTTDPFEVVKEITKYRRIISSSLHGIICAHSFGIPAAWCNFSYNLKGDNTKFEDYYSSVGLSAELSSIKDPIFKVPDHINTEPIINIFKNLKEYIHEDMYMDKHHQ